ncbi:MAG: PepSY domain-containing protein, partial [Sphingomonas sp.]
MARAKPLAVTHLSLDTAIASAQATLPGELRQVTWPTDLKPEWKITLAGDARPSVTVDDATGAAKAGRIVPEDTARLMRRIHDGTRMGALWQTIIFIGGILPAILAVTGIIMWWRARKWRGDLKARRT